MVVTLTVAICARCADEAEAPARNMLTAFSEGLSEFLHKLHPSLQQQAWPWCLSAKRMSKVHNVGRANSFTNRCHRTESSRGCQRKRELQLGECQAVVSCLISAWSSFRHAFALLPPHHFFMSSPGNDCWQTKTSPCPEFVTGFSCGSKLSDARCNSCQCRISAETITRLPD